MDHIKGDTMRFQFDPHQPYQEDAIHAVTDLFDGQPSDADQLVTSVATSQRKLKWHDLEGLTWDDVAGLTWNDLETKTVGNLSEWKCSYPHIRFSK